MNMNATFTADHEYDSGSLSEPVPASDSSEAHDDSIREAEEARPPPKKMPSVGGTKRPPAGFLSQQQDSSDTAASSAATPPAAGAVAIASSANGSGSSDDDNMKKKAAVSDGVGARRAPGPAPAPKPAPSAVGAYAADAVPPAAEAARDTEAAERVAREAAKNEAYGDASRAGAVAVEDSCDGDIELGIVSIPDEAAVKPPAANESPTEDSEEPSPAVVAAAAAAAAAGKADEEVHDSAPDVPSPTTPSPVAEEAQSPSPALAASPDLPSTNEITHELPKAILISDHATALREESEGGDAEGADVVVAAALVCNPGEEEGRKTVCGNWLSPTQWAVGALLIVVLIVVGVVVGITQTKPPKETPAPTSAPSEEIVGPTMDPTSCTPFDPFSDTLHFLTLQALKDPCSPQSRANTWMMKDPNLASYDEDRKLQRFALATLYFSTDGEKWIHNDLWLDYDQDECQWYNQENDGETVVCNDDFSILHLSLAYNDLNGVLPVELFFFPALATLDLSHNKLRGTAPTMFAGARFLQRLVLSSNQLTGQFTAELGFVASQLAVLHNDDNQFTGAVPGLLRLLPHLSHLNITGNQYTGSLPGSLIQLSETLTSLEVSDNAITGEIPTELGAASKLQVLDLGNNAQLGGTIPAVLGDLTDLTTLVISNTAISGPLPGELCSLQQQGQLQVLADCDGSFECCDVLLRRANFEG